MEKVLLTGGAGFVGSFLAERLVSDGVKVRIFDNLSRGSIRNLKELNGNIELTHGDIRDYSDVRAVAKGIDTIFHLASVQGTRFFYEKPDLVLEVGLLGCLNVARAAGERRVRHVIFSSSSEVYGSPSVFPTPENHPLVIPDPKNPRWSYASTKLVGEIIFLNYGRLSGFQTSVVRIHNAYGPRMGWDHVVPEFCVRLILGDKFTMEGTGRETRSFCYISDIVDGMILVADRDGGGEVFNLGNDKEEVSIHKLARTLAKISGKRLSPTFLPLRKGSAERRKPDLSRARRLLGYEPKVSLRVGLKKTYQWYEKEVKWWIRNVKPQEYPWQKKAFQ